MISILIPCYEYKITDLVFTLVKMMENESIPYEIIVKDDGSKNQYFITANQEVNSLSNCTYHYNNKNQGRTVTRNELAKMASYPTLLFLDADVVPLNRDFLKKYITYISQSYDVVCGGCFYIDSKPSKEFILRWKYGKSREQNSAKERNKKPYSYVFSGNILINKELFLTCNFSENKNFYGMDNLFSYNLFTKKVTLLHIDNEIIHLGLEPNSNFLKKSLESVNSRHEFLVNQPNSEKINSLIRHYKTLKKLKICSLIGFLFNKSKSIFEKNLLGSNPSLFLFDLYRLGYLCTLKNYKLENN